MQNVGEGLLARITGPDDVKALPEEQLPALCAEIRSTLLKYGHWHGGHIGSNLGMVEATVALHRVFDSPHDRIVFDVSHQTYVHKMLTGRALAYLDPAHADEVTGFTNPDESEHDQFVLGHTGTSISLACGLAKARDLRGDTGNVVAVIGDGSLSSGVAFEGLNNAAEQGTGMVIVFNDNEMSISGDFGGMYGPLARLRASEGTAEPNMFKAFGLDYRYVADGNDVMALVRAFREVRGTTRPVVVHIHTVKGLGLPAEETTGHNAQTSHRTAPSVPASGQTGQTDQAAPSSITSGWHGASDECDLSGTHLHAGHCEAAHWQMPDSALGRPDDPRKHYGKLAMAALERRFAMEPGLVVISPATPGSNGITHAFRERAGSHYIDTGITESHAVAVAAGIAKAGGTPVVATTASFFQRAYDQFFQELALNRMPVTLLDFLGGLSGSDNTHSGAYDVTMFGNIPDLTCLAPTSGAGFLGMLAWATDPARRGGPVPGPVVIRVPGEAILARDTARGELTPEPLHMNAGTDWLHWQITRAGSRVAMIGLGNTHPLAEQAADLLADRAQITATVIDPRCCSRVDEAALEALRSDHQVIVTLEDGQLDGGWGEKVTAYGANHWHEAASASCPVVLNVGAAKEFTDRVPLARLNERYGLTPEAIVERVLAAL